MVRNIVVGAANIATRSNRMHPHAPQSFIHSKVGHQKDHFTNRIDGMARVQDGDSGETTILAC